MTRPSDEGRCDLCGEPMPEGEEMFRLHGYSGPCPKPPLPVTTPTHCACVWHGQADGPPFSECHYHATLRADLAAAKASIPTGWSVRTNCDAMQRWIVITGPRGQSAAFEVDHGSVRAEVLRDLARDFDAAIGEGKRGTI